MDEFGVLVESIGFRAQGKSAPMAKLKPKPKSQFTTHNTASFQDSYSLPVDELDGIFRSNASIGKTRQPQYTIVDDDIFGGPVSGSSQYGGIDLDSVFSSSSNGNNLNTRKSGGVDAYDDLLGSNSKRASPVDDLLGGFGQNSRGKQEKKVPGFDDLIPGFGGASPSKAEVYSDTNISRESSGRPSRSSSPVIDDPFSIFESSTNQSNASWTFDEPSDQNTRKGSFPSSIDDLDDFVMGGARSGSKVDAQRNTATKPSSGRSSNVIDDLDDFVMGGARSGSKVVSQRNTAKNPSSGTSSNVIDDLDDFIMGGARSGSKVDAQEYTAKKPTSGRSSNVFESANFVDDIFGGQQNNASRPRSMSQNSLFGEFVDDAKEPEVKQTSSWSSSSTKKAASVANVGNDFTSLFGDVTTSSGEFQEIDGEPEERRRARLDRHMRTNARMAKALSEKNQRDLQSQHEHEEKCRLAETLDYDIKRWATGKEGNLRALLSSLQQVLWAECGWRPVSLTDMITSDSVKKVYKKATLCVHPDKVQQKGASLQQKYIAEKVFDLLKEAWNKFSAEELR